MSPLVSQRVSGGGRDAVDFIALTSQRPSSVWLAIVVFRAVRMGVLGCVFAQEDAAALQSTAVAVSTLLSLSLFLCVGVWARILLLGFFCSCVVNYCYCLCHYTGADNLSPGIRPDCLHNQYHTAMVHRPRTQRFWLGRPQCTRPRR